MATSLWQLCVNCPPCGDTVQFMMSTDGLKEMSHVYSFLVTVPAPLHAVILCSLDIEVSIGKLGGSFFLVIHRCHHSLKFYTGHSNRKEGQ
jgi:hypothetical protein